MTWSQLKCAESSVRRMEESRAWNPDVIGLATPYAHPHQIGPFPKDSISSSRVLQDDHTNPRRLSATCWLRSPAIEIRTAIPQWLFGAWGREAGQS